MFSPLQYPLAFRPPRYLSGGSAWVEHIPFALALVDILRPRTVVELGTAFGDSYLALCQAVDELALPCRCTAVDTWQGDPHGGNYGPGVLQSLRAYHDPTYGRFSRLLEANFDQALPTFADGSIDLLHIDGFHTYQAVHHDLTTWLPKLSPRGVVLLHDTVERRDDFGVWKLWAEVRHLGPSFEFHHGSGLGVLAPGTQPEPAIARFLEEAGQDPEPVRTFFAYLGRQVVTERIVRLLTIKVRELAGEVSRLQLAGAAASP